MMKGSWANKIVARLNWGAFDHASHAPQLSVATITFRLLLSNGLYETTFCMKNITLVA